MTRRAATKALQVLVVGGGVAGLEALLALRALAGERVATTLLAPESAFAYRPLSVAEPFSIEHPHRLELERVAADTGARLVRDALREVDATNRTVSTAGGETLAYDALLVAIGARTEVALPGATTFRGPADVLAVRFLLDDAARGAVRSIAFAVVDGPTWPLPLYELALMSAAHLTAEHARAITLDLVTPEAAPLEVFGDEASEATRRLLELRGITLHTGRTPAAVEPGSLTLADGGSIPAERVVALPRLRGPAVAGLPADADGFLPVDEHGAVTGVEGVWAAGDGTAFPVKQGGLAAQQADAAAAAIAALAGAEVEPAPFQPVLRTVLLTGATPTHIEAELTAEGRPASSTAASHALWWPPSKVYGRHLSPYLEDEVGIGVPVEARDELEATADRGGPGADADHRAALAMALEQADDDASRSDYALALSWLDAAESLATALPPEYAHKRTRWTKLLHAHGGSSGHAPGRDPGD